MTTNHLYRSRTDRMCCGVCGGLGEYFDVDATLVRLFCVIATILTGGLVILVYLVMSIVVPELPFGMSQKSAPDPSGMAAGIGAESGESPFGTGPSPQSGFTGGSARFSGSSGYDPIHHRRQWIGWALVALGALVLMANLNLLRWLNLHETWPVFLILGGLLLLLRQRSPY
ncbi:MAG: PspC domain-containing protein [Chloroflexota bacterium]